MSFIVNCILNFFQNIVRVFMNKQKTISNSLSIFIRCNSGKTLSLDLDPKWDIKNVKTIIAEQIGGTPEEVKIIFAGKELQDSTIIEDCNLGQQSILHAVKHTRLASRSLVPLENMPEEQSLTSETLENDDAAVEVSQNKGNFYVYCNSCKKLCPGKLRVRCLSCKSGAIMVDSDPQSWSDILEGKRISGVCEQDGCPDGAMGWAEFYFKCGDSRHAHDNVDAIPLNLIKNNSKHVLCLACFEIRDLVFVYPCKSSHVTCLDCFKDYAVVRLRERQFIFDEKYGYTLPCPANCADSAIKECHHFKLLDRKYYDTYQRFGAEEYVLKSGGLLCPFPGCGAGIIPDSTCDKVVCRMGCEYVFCRKCLEGYHFGECAPKDNNSQYSGTIQYTVDTERASAARWDGKAISVQKKVSKPCPSCRIATERDGGCMHMVCTRCNYSWCWICQEQWTRSCMGDHWFG